MASNQTKKTEARATKGQRSLLLALRDKGPHVVAGTLGTTARICRERGWAVSNGTTPPIHRISPEGEAELARGVS
jgi:hypothetical protein